MHEVDPFSSNELIDASTQIKFGTSNYLFITQKRGNECRHDKHTSCILWCVVFSAMIVYSGKFATT